MNRKGILITASIMSAVIASSGANVAIAQQPSPPSANQDDSSELKTKFEDLKKSGQEKGEKFIDDSDRKDSILKTPAEDLIIKLNIIQSILSGINKDNPNNHTYFERYVYPELLKIPKITNSDGKSEEAKRASEQLMKISESLQNLIVPKYWGIPSPLGLAYTLSPTFPQCPAVTAKGNPFLPGREKATVQES